MVSFSSVRVALCPALLLVGVERSARADEAPQRPNLLVVTVEGLDGVGAPAEGLEEVLFDPEVRARATPNLQRLVGLGASFDNAYPGRRHSAAIDFTNVAAHARVKGGYLAGGVTFDAIDPPPNNGIGGAWSSPSGETRRRWIKLVPKDPTIANWERLAEVQDAIATASAVAETIGSGVEEAKPRMLVAQLGDGESPYVPGVFFDRFPLDQIDLPLDVDDRRALAARMGAYDLDVENLSDGDQRDWKLAIQAWLASASALDYAVGVIVDAIEERTDDDAPWVVVLVTTPSDLPPRRAVREVGARADLAIVAPGVTGPGQRVATPVDLGGLERTLIELIGIDPEPLNDFDKPVSSGAGTFMRPILGKSFLPLLAPAGERYDLVAITRAGGAGGVRSHRFRLVHLGDGSQELYDLEKDPAGFYDLLDPDNAAKVERFGLTETQVEAVRRWHTLQLYWRLADDGAPDADLDQLAAAAGLDSEERAAGAPPAVTPGDYNRDGIVNAADGTVWRDQNGEEVPVGAGADGDHDGRIDDEDNAIWRANYGRRAENP